MVWRSGLRCRLERDWIVYSIPSTTTEREKDEGRHLKSREHNIESRMTISRVKEPSVFIQGTMAKREGASLKDPTREKCWLGAALVRKLVTALLDDSLVTGTLNWDVTIYRALSIVFIAALATRAGDITRSNLDTQLRPYLCYNDITMKLVNGTDIINIEAQVIIRNEKVYK